MSVLGHQDMIMLRWQQTVRSFTALLRTELVSGFCSDETYHFWREDTGRYEKESTAPYMANRLTY